VMMLTVVVEPKASGDWSLLLPTTTSTSSSTTTTTTTIATKRVNPIYMYIYTYIVY